MSLNNYNEENTAGEWWVHFIQFVYSHNNALRLRQQCTVTNKYIIIEEMVTMNTYL